jgi:hypothetical protein
VTPAFASAKIGMMPKRDDAVQRVLETNEWRLRLLAQRLDLLERRVMVDVR